MAMVMSSLGQVLDKENKYECQLVMLSNGIEINIDEVIHLTKAILSIKIASYLNNCRLSLKIFSKFRETKVEMSPI